jgi:integrase
MGKRGRPKGSLSKRRNHHVRFLDGQWQVRIVSRELGDTRTWTGTADVEEARRIRDRLFAETEAKRGQVRAHAALGLPAVGTVKALVAMYLDSESGTYDREKGGEQPGCKRTADADRVLEKRIFRFLDGSLSADAVDVERLLDLAAGMEKANLAALTRRHAMRFLSRVFTWSQAHPRRTGIVATPFARLDKQSAEWKQIFPRGRVAKQAPPLSREQLRKMYELLPGYAMRPIRFDAHTGMRCPSELLNMVWGRVDFEKKVYRTDPRWTKGGEEREVPLGNVAIGILKGVLPADPAPTDAVWLGPDGGPLKDFRSSFEKAVRAVCKAPEPGWRYPTIHSLRRTCATALEQVASKAVAAKVLGHSAADVTDRYVQPSLDDCLIALDRAALLIDGEPSATVVPLRRGRLMAKRMANGV